MKKHRSHLSIFLGSAIIALSIPAESFSQTKFESTAQVWASYATYNHTEDSTSPYNGESSQLGIGLRRARIRVKSTQGKAAGFIQYELASSKLLDLRLDYRLTDNFKLRMGRFVGPGSQASSRTSHLGIDLIERSIVGRFWGDAVDRPDHRSYGLAAMGKLSRIEYEVMASNGSGDLDLKPYNTKSSKSNTVTGKMPQLDFMAYMRTDNGFFAGAHYGLPNEDRVDVEALTGFVYYTPPDYGSGKFRAKFDYAEIVDEGAAINSSSEKPHSRGYSLLGMFRLSEKVEVGGRYGAWDDNLNSDDDAVANITVGLNYSPDPDNWKTTLFKFSATFKTAEAENKPFDPLILHFMWQQYFR